VKLLLDENLPHKLRTLLPAHDCFTVTNMRWNGIQNGELLRLAAANGFDALITTDKGLEYEQNLGALPLSVVVVIARDNKLKTIEALVPRLVSVWAVWNPKPFQKLSALASRNLISMGA
jgi:predicted nuclease of predicted toxin-antitoxin system